MKVRRAVRPPLVGPPLTGPDEPQTPIYDDAHGWAKQIICRASYTLTPFLYKTIGKAHVPYILEHLQMEIAAALRAARQQGRDGWKEPDNGPTGTS